MVRKHIHHFSRGVVIGAEILGILVIIFFTAWLLLLARLSQGPLEAGFLTHRMEEAFNRASDDFSFSIGSTVLTWGGAGKPFIFEMRNFQVNRVDKTPVFSVEKVGVQLSKRRLAFGKISPRVIRVYSPALRVVRGEDGNFALNIGGNGEALASAAPQAGHMDFIKGLLSKMESARGGSLLGGLRELSIADAALLYEDKVLGASWKSSRSDIVVTRGRAGLAVDTTVNIDQGEGRLATVRGSFSYDRRAKASNGVIGFTNINPAQLAQQSEALKPLAGIDLPLRGSISVVLDENFSPIAGQFALGAEPGTFSGLGLYADPVPVTSFYMRGRINVALGELALEQLQADVGGPKVSATGAMMKREEGHDVTLNATLEGMPLDKLKVYWPPALAADARRWVTGHLSAGTASKATLELSLLSPHACAPSCARPWDDFGPAKLQKVGGQIDFHGIKVDYFPPLMPVTKVAGKATYDHKSFNLDVAGGELGDMQVTGSKIAITDLDVADADTHSKIDISASLKGPLRTALRVLDSKPLEYPKNLGISVDDAAGDAVVDVNFKFPLYEKLTLDEVKVTAEAKLDNVLLNNMVAGMPLSGGPMDLSLGKGALTVKGKGLLGTAPVAFDWMKNFAEKADIASRVEATLPLDAEMLAAFGVPASLKVAGTIPAAITYVVAAGEEGSLLFKGDVTQAAFTLPVLNYEKPPQEAGSLEMSLRLRGGLLSSIDNLTLSVGKAHLAGGVAFASDGVTLKSANFTQVRLGDTDVAISAASRGSDGYDIRISGAQFDASGLLNEDEAPGSDEEAAKKTMPFNLTMQASRLLTGKNGRGISDLKMSMRRNEWGRIDRLEADGVAGSKPLSLRYLPAPSGHTLRFEAGNAGAALSAMGISQGVRGGRIVVDGAPSRSDPGTRNLRGLVTMTDFTLVNVPVLGKLLNALSLSGFIELLNGKGIAFKKMRADFSWADRGQPETDKNVRRITLKDGQTSGASLGLTFEGVIDQWNNTLNLNGTIIPVSDVNKVLGAIPVVGNILTGGGKGIFAATYTVKGPKDKPDVAVNPLSVLAPGIFRKLFFEK
jgi:hypothetical protein